MKIKDTKKGDALYDDSRRADWLRESGRVCSCQEPTAALVTGIRFTFDNRMEALEKAMEEGDRFLKAQEASPKLAYAVRLALEELITNIIKYGYDDLQRHSIEVLLELAPPAVMTVTDDGHPFNPLADAPVPTLEGDVEERPIGGLGLHMLREMGMQLDYRREQDRNILRVVFPAD